MEESFQSFNAVLEAESVVREEVKKITKEIEQIGRQLTALLQTLHNRNANSIHYILFIVFNSLFNLSRMIGFFIIMIN